MLELIFSESALADIASIEAYIAEDNAYAATRMAQTIINACDRLRSFPESAPRGYESGTREMVVRPFVVIYQVQPGRIDILRVWHGAQRA